MIVRRGLAAWLQCLVANDPYIWLAARVISFVYVWLDASPQSTWDRIFLDLNEAGHQRPPIAAIAQSVEFLRSLANECSVEMSWPHDSGNEVVSANRTSGSTIDGVMWGFRIPPIINSPYLNATPRIRVWGRIWGFPRPSVTLLWPTWFAPQDESCVCVNTYIAPPNAACCGADGDGAEEVHLTKHRAFV